MAIFIMRKKYLGTYFVSGFNYTANYCRVLAVLEACMCEKRTEHWRRALDVCEARLKSDDLDDDAYSGLCDFQGCFVVYGIGIVAAMSAFAAEKTFFNFQTARKNSSNRFPGSSYVSIIKSHAEK